MTHSFTSCYTIKNEKLVIDMKRNFVLLVTTLLLFTLCACSVPATVPQPSFTPDNTLQVSFIDVGQGDSELITLPDGKTILIDAGEAKTADALIRSIQSLGAGRLDYIIGTHPHADHIGGMAKVIDAFDVGAVYLPKVEHDTKTFENLLLAVKEKGLKINTAKAGVILLNEAGVRAEFLAPCADKYKDLNNYSAVLRLTYQDVSFLFMGDAEQESERQIIKQASEGALSANVIKLGHHGSSTSSSKAFLEAVSPSIAVISCGEGNSYGHPHAETLQTLDRLGITVYRTDESGTVTVSTDGTALQVQTQR